LLNCTTAQLEAILDGTTRIKAPLAGQLQRMTRIPADSWLRFEAEYRADLARLVNKLQE